MFTDAKDVQTDLIGALDLTDELTHPIGWTYSAAFLEVCGCETINSNLHIPHAPNGTMVMS